MYAIMVMTALGCGGDIICWKPIHHMAQFNTMEECKFFLKHAIDASHHHLSCRPVEGEAEPPNPFEDVPP